LIFAGEQHFTTFIMSTVTLKKISEHLNMNISTVSRALKNHPDIAPETKRRVKELSDMLDYEPNAFAVNLRKKHSNLYAIIVPEISSYFYHSFIDAIEAEARNMGYSIMILQSMNNPEIEKENLRLCRHNHVAGVFVALCSNTNNYEHFERFSEQEIPIVFFDKVPETGEFNKICIDDYNAAYLAAQKLAETNPLQILALLGNEKLSITHRRKDGLSDFFNTLNNNTAIKYTYCENEQQAQTEVTQFVNKNKSKSGIFCMSDLLLCGAVKALQTLQINIPNQASVICLSNGFFPKLFTPEISYIETSGYKLGTLAFGRMKDAMLDKKTVKELFLQSNFFVGKSL
jgi:LacI family transcriptional regulator